MVKHGIRHSRLGNDWQDSFHSISDFLTDFLFLSFSAKFQHAVVGGIAMDQMRCLISRRTALGQEKNFVSQPASQLLPGLMPKIRGEQERSFALLRGTWQVHNQAGEFAAGVVGRQEIDAVILMAFDVSENLLRLGFCKTIHVGFSLVVLPAPVPTHHGVIQSIGHATRLAGLPSLFHTLRERFCHKGSVFRHSHRRSRKSLDLFGLNFSSSHRGFASGLGSRMRVRGAQNDRLGI